MEGAKMGIDAHMQDESGRVLDSVLDPQGLLQNLISQIENDDSSCLRFIDPYGDTIFNVVQMEPLIAELTSATTSAMEKAGAEHGHAVLALSARRNSAY
jgi:hypothetical protein